VYQWDTANIYSNGQSEKLMGKAMQAYNIPRRKLIIMTKYYRVTCDSDNYDVAAKVAMHGSLADQSRDYVNQWGMSILPGSSLNLIFEARMANSVNTSRAFQGINIQRS
jgi:aryl-alcohol dehydrogenase-like predicted oxidoreductase